MSDMDRVIASIARDYLDETGGNAEQMDARLAEGHRPGQAFFNALSDVDRYRLRGTAADPFHGDWNHVDVALDRLTRGV